MKSILIDSDILIEVSRGRDAVILAKWDDLGRGETVLTCSPVTVAKLWHGARPQEHKILEALFAVTQISARFDGNLTVGPYTRHQSLPDFSKTRPR